MKDRFLSRKGFLALAATAGTSLLMGGEAAAKDTEDQQDDWFIKFPTNLETRLETLQGWLTPNDRFFVRNNSTSTPRLEAASYRLKIEGDALTTPFELTLDELKAMPHQNVVATLECAGNWRRFYKAVYGKAARGGQWGTGGVGCAEWSGVRLSDVLQRAGVTRKAHFVHLIGLDKKAPEGGFNKPMPIEKAMDPDTLLVTAMNGESLPFAHGYPVRALVPGWAGSNNIKWLGRIRVVKDPVRCRNNTSSYVLIGPDWPNKKPVQKLNIKSALQLPWPAALRAGKQPIRGYAYSPDGPIKKVEWRVDGGDWREARFISPALKYAWVRFEFIWNAPKGNHDLQVRATDSSGTTQPDTVPYNAKGYLLNVPLKHPVSIT